MFNVLSAGTDAVICPKKKRVVIPSIHNIQRIVYVKPKETFDESHCALRRSGCLA